LKVIPAEIPAKWCTLLGAMRDADLAPLQRAFGLLVKQARPALAARALRAGLAVLVSDVSRRRVSRPISSPVASPRAHAASTRVNGAASKAVPTSDWENLRSRLHAIIAHCDPTERRAIAAELGVAPTTLRNLCSTTPPGKAVAARAAQWLAARQAGAISTDVATTPAEPETVNGADSAAACHLTSQMCDQLNFLIQTDPRAVRQSGVRLETARHAALGGAVEPPIAERLVKFLEAG
jgi:hypothetical protein